MKSSILTFSQTGNTLKVANAISKGLEKCGLAVSLVRFHHRHNWRPDKADIIGIGCPCFESQPAECVPNFLSGNGFGSVRFQDTCMVCYRCWNVCPANAIDIVFSPGSGWIERHLYSESMERRFGNVEPREFYGTNLYEQVLTRKIKLKYHRTLPTADYERVQDP